MEHPSPEVLNIEDNSPPPLAAPLGLPEQGYPERNSRVNPQAPLTIHMSACVCGVPVLCPPSSSCVVGYPRGPPDMYEHACM